MDGDRKADETTTVFAGVIHKEHRACGSAWQASSAIV